ncbi:MAG: type II secretion system protein [Myxococcota bacterium]
MKVKRNLRRLTGRRGFSLVELGVVLAVMSVIVAIVVPDFIESAKNELAQRAATQAYNLQGIAREFYHQQALTLKNPALARWPGENANGYYNAPDCTPGLKSPTYELRNLPSKKNPMITQAEITNPWGRELYMHIEKSEGAGSGVLAGAACKFIISTDIPSPVAGVFETYVPGGICNGRPGMIDPCRIVGDDPASGFVRCCLPTARPGVEAALSVSLARASAEKIKKGGGRRSK